MPGCATSALDRANIPWRLSFTSPSLSGIWAAVAAGLPPHLRIINDPALPVLPMLGPSLHRMDAEPELAVQRLREIILETLMGEDLGQQLKAA